jgi:hypothetical protein
MDKFDWISIALEAIIFLTLAVGVIYYEERAKRTEVERQELHEELQRVASFLAQSRNTYYGQTGEVIGEIIERLANSLPRFGALVRPGKH